MARPPSAAAARHAPGLARQREVRFIRLTAFALLLLLSGVTLRAGLDVALAPITPAEAMPWDHGEPIVRVRLDSLGSAPWTISATNAGTLWIDPGDGAGFESAGGRITRDDKLATLAGRVFGAAAEIHATDGDVVINDRIYPGFLRVVTRDDATILVLNVPLETYLAHVLPHEMPLYYPIESLRAQAIASRSYVLAAQIRRRAQRHDVSDTEASQVFRSSSRVTERSRDIVASTARRVLIFGGRPFSAYFSANCGGVTRSNREAFSETMLPPLQGRDCGFCEWSEDYRWRHVVSVTSLRASLDLPPVVSVEIVSARDSGYDADLLFKSPRGDVPVSARRLRGALGYHKIKSTKIIAAEVRGGQLRIDGMGFGHGVGMCQTGARGLAQAGKSAEDILHYYYPGGRIARIDW